MDDRELLGGKLRETRERLGITQDSVARYLGLTRSAISQYESGRRDIGLGNLQKLADLFGYSTAYFIADGPVPNSPAIAFRTEGLADEDLELVAWAKRFMINMSDLGRLLGGEERSR